MDRSDRLIILLVFVAVAAWRLVRFLRLGMSKPRSSLGEAGGWLPTNSESSLPKATASTSSDPKRGPIVRIIEPVVAVVTWLVGNFLIWISLFELPYLRSTPPALLGMAWIFANFYLIPLARRIGADCARHIDGRPGPLDERAASLRVQNSARPCE
jgi:hypothetical protein